MSPVSRSSDRPFLLTPFPPGFVLGEVSGHCGFLLSGHILGVIV